MKLYFKTNERLKKIFNYFSIFTIVLGTTFGSINSAYAGDVTISSTATITADNITDADGDSLIINEGDVNAIIATLSLDVPATVDDIELGENGADVQTTTLQILSGSSALTIAAPIVGVAVDDNDINNIIIESSVANSAASLVTLSGVIGPGPLNSGALISSNGENDIDTITVGQTDAAGNAKFTGATVETTTFTVIGGDNTNEVSVADIAGDLNTTAIVLDDTVATSKIIFSSSSAVDILGTINGGENGEGTVQVTGTDITFDGIIGGSADIGTLDVDNSVTFNAAVSSINIDVAAGKTATFDKAVTAENITLAGTTGKMQTKGIGTVTIAGDITGGILQTITTATTFSGTVGSVAAPTVLDLDIGSTFNSAVVSSTVSIADAITADFDANLTADTITLGSDVAGGTISFTGSSAQTVAGNLVSFDTDKKGTITSNNSAGVTFSNNIGTDALSIALMTNTESSTVNGNIYAEQITAADNKSLTAKGNIEIGTGDIVLSGAADAGYLTAGGGLVLAGTSAQTVSTASDGTIIGGGAGQGRVNISNAAGATIDVVMGTDSAEIDLLSTSGTGHLILKNASNFVDDLDINSNTTLELSTDIAASANVFTTTGISDAYAADSTLIMPVNLASGSSITLITNNVATNLADVEGDVENALLDTALVDFSSAVTDTVKIAVTATDKSTATTSSELGVTTNNATAIFQARDAIIAGSDSTALTAIGNAMNATGGYSSTEDTSLTKQVAPQDDMISGSTFATKAMTGSVQGIMSNRMAALRSGDAYYGSGMSAGSLSANSGFIQVFGSDVEQKNKTVGSGTQFGYDASTAGIALGFDGITDGGSVVGLSLSTSQSDVDGKGTGNSKNDIDSYTASIYMDKSTDAGYIEGSLTIGMNENSTSRIVNTAGLDRTYKGDYDSYQASLNLSGGIPNDTGNGFVTPFGGVSATQIQTDSYTETSSTAADSLRLTVDQDDVTSIVGTVGIKYHNVLDNGGVPMISLAINNEFGDNTIESNNTYQGGGTSFKTSTDVEELSATLGLGYTFASDNTSLELSYEADANDDDYLSHYGSIKLVGKF